MNANLKALQAANIAGLARQIAAPKFNWEPGIRQTDQLVKNIQRGKLSATEFFDVYRNRTQELATYQARISRAFATPLAGGATAVTIPAASQMNTFASATEMANRRLAVQAEVLHGLGQKVQDWGKNTQWAGRQMMVGMTVPFAMGAAAAAMYANKIDAAMVRVEKVVNEPLEGFREKALNTAKEVTNAMGQTMESTLGVMSELAAAGESGQALQDLTKLSQTLATLGDMDQEASIKGIISMQQIWKMSTDELSKSVDYLNYVEDQTATKLSDLIDGIPVAGVQVAQLGGTIQDTTVLLTAFRQSGINTLEGANAIKTAMNRILSPTRGAADTFKELTGKDLPSLVKATEGKPLETFQALSDVIMGGNIAMADQQRIISKLVGTYQSSRITALLTGLQDQTGDVHTAKEISGESPEQWAARTAKSLKAITESASGQWRIAVESFKAEFIETGEIVLKIATSIVKAATKVFSIFNDMPDVVKWGLLLGAGIMALAGPITMIVGILGNFFGTIIKVGAVFQGMRSKYKSMTIDQKVAELTTGSLSAKMLSQADTTQILIYQMEKLRAAYVQTTNAAQAAATAVNIPGGPGWNAMGAYAMGKTPGLTMPIGGANMPGGGAPLLGTNAWAGQTATLIANSGNNMATLAQNTQQAGKFQRIFNSEALIGVGAVAALAGTVTETGSGLADWLNWISLGSVALGAVLPLVTKIGTAIKGWAAAKNIGGAASGLFQSAKGFGAKLLDSGKTAMKGIGAFALGPWGIGIGAGLLAIWGVTKLISAAQEEQNRYQSAMVNSTDAWAKILGQTKVEWGQMRDDSGEVKDNIASIVKKMREEMPDLVNEMSGAGPRYLEILTEREALKLQGQGIDKKEIMNNLDALLQAAGRSRQEIDRILGHIEVRFDFANGAKDLKQFIDTTGQDLKSELDRWMFEMPASDSYGDKRSPQQDQTAERIAGLFYDRLGTMDPAQRAVFAQNWADDMNKGFNDAFNKLEKEHGSDIAKNWKDAKAKFFNWDAGENKWVTDREAITGAGLSVDSTEINQMKIMIDTEQRLTQAIARTLKVNEDKVRGMSILTDIMPYVTDQNLTAKDAQEAYNNTIKEAKENGKELNDEEKNKLATLLATQFGLDAATLAANGYSEANKKSATDIRQNAQELQAFVEQMKSFAGAADDFWASTAVGEGGFADALGGDVNAQAQQLTEQVKGIYSGAMGDIYGAMADQAQEQWQARLDAITNSFEARKDAVQRQIDASDKAYEAKQEAFQDRWDERIERSKKSFEDRQKAIEKGADKQIEAIEKQIDSEQEREDARQRQFEAEERRIERLTELANRTIDYNRALASGNLDEAARVMNNTEAVQAGWRSQDARDSSQLLSKQQIDQLNARKELISKQKQARLDALREEEEATEKSLQKQRDMEQKSMERARDIERQRLQAKLDGLNREQRVAEETERRKQAMDRRTLEIELATLKAFVPKNEAELAAHVARISSAYANYGLNLQTSGGYWGKIIGNALSNNVNRARQEMSNNAQWSAFGSSVAGAISKGAFGLSLGDFFKLIATGQPPKGWKPPGTKGMSGGTFAQRPGGRMFYHTGGLVGSGISTEGRPGRGNSPLGGDEVPTILQRGEYVFPRSAVQLYGSEYLSRLAAGTPPAPQQTTGVAGMMGALMGAMGHSIIGLAMNNLMTWAASQYGGGGGTGAAVDFARAQDGKPYIWGSTGPAGYDCSGYMSAIANVLTGKDNPYQRVFATGMVNPGQAFGPFEPGLGGIFSIGVKHGNPGHTAGTLMGVGVESTGDHVRYGKDASLATDKQFTMHFHIPEDKIAAGAAIPGMGYVAGEPGSDKVQQRVKAVAAQYGWANGDQWVALYNLIQKESSWNPNAANPTSSARGLFQKMTSIHGGLESTIEGQAQWGLNYIRGKYGSPLAAWLFHQRNNWYDQGGDLLPGMTGVMNGTGKPETVVTFDQHGALMEALEVANITYRGLQTQIKAIAPAVNNAAVAQQAGDTYNTYNVNVDGSGLSAKELELAIMSGIEKAEERKAKRRGLRK